MKNSFVEKHISKIWLTGVMAFLYIVQFLVFPQLFPNYFRTSNEAIGMYWLSMILVLLLGGWFFSNKLRDWFLGDLVYIILPCIYSANGAYGVGYENYYHITSVLIEMLFSASILVILQWVVLTLFRKILKDRD